MSCGQAGTRVRRAAGRWRFLRGTLGITAWTCVYVCARPEALCTTRTCICRLGFVKLHPRPLYMFLRVLVCMGGWGAGPQRVWLRS